jgi:hypothetical protein
MSRIFRTFVLPIVLPHRYMIVIKIAVRSIIPSCVNQMYARSGHPLEDNTKFYVSRMSPDLSLPALSSRHDIQRTFIGKDIGGLPKPAAILDIAKAACHCKDMLDAIKWLGVDFRAHVKTHKVS